MMHPFSKPLVTLLLKVAALATLFFAGAPVWAQQKANVKNAVLVKVDQSASFPGGQEKFYAFLAKNVRYPALAREKNVQGKVFISFVVEKDGSLKNITVRKGPGAGINEEAVRVLAASPKWIPAKNGGKTVRSQYTVPISFTLDNKAAAAPASDRPVNKSQVYKQVDEAASFPGGVQGLYAFLAKTVHYPALAREKNVQGKVFVSFVVEEDGELTGIQVKRGIGAGCDEEAVRALQNSPKWIPAKLHGENVKEEYVVPISFSLVKS